MDIAETVASDWRSPWRFDPSRPASVPDPHPVTGLSQPIVTITAKGPRYAVRWFTIIDGEKLEHHADAVGTSALRTLLQRTIRRHDYERIVQHVLRRAR